MIYPKVPMAEYVRDSFALGPPRAPSLSSSVAHLLLTRSPAHARVAHPGVNPVWVEKERTAFDLGSAAHAVLLEDNRAALVVVDAPTWQTKAAKEARAVARADAKVPVLAHQAADIEMMVTEAKAAMARCFDLRDLGPLLAEQTILWQQPDPPGYGPTWCRCRPDWITEDHAVILSYKTTGNAHPDAFARLVDAMGYDVQAAFELAGVRASTGVAAKYVWMAQETEPPYAVSFVGLTPDLADLGDHKRRVAVGRWAECLRTGSWPGYPDRICWIEALPWARARWLEYLGEHGDGSPPPPDVDDGRPLDEQLFGGAP